MKLNTSYNFVWAKKYNGLTFKRLLTSKTGAIYFIARHDSTPFIHNYFGKINADGNINWCKRIPLSSQGGFSCNLEMMQLDRNSDLVLTTSMVGVFLKTDTLGNLLKAKQIDNVRRNEIANMAIITDSAGIYTFAGYGFIFENYGVTILKYSDINDNVTRAYEYSNYYGQTGSGFNGQSDYKIYKSRNKPSDYYVFAKVYPNSWQTDITLDIIKFRGNQFLWKMKVDDINIEGVEEDYLKSLCVLGSKNGQFNSQKDVFIYRFDSLGNMENYKYNYMTLFGSNSVDSLAKDSLFNISTVTGQMFYSSILTRDYIQISRFAFFPGYTCMSEQNIAFTHTPLSINTVAGPNNYTVYNLPEVTLVNSSSIAVTALPFIATKEDCWLVTNQDENIKESESLNVYPNPTTGYVNISLFVEKENITNYRMEVSDVLGKVVLTTLART